MTTFSSKPIVCCGDSPVSFLTRCVPNLSLDNLFILKCHWNFFKNLGKSFFYLSLPISRERVANSTPIVDFESKLNWSHANLKIFEFIFSFCYWSNSNKKRTEIRIMTFKTIQINFIQDLFIYRLHIREGWKCKKFPKMAMAMFYG